MLKGMNENVENRGNCGVENMKDTQHPDTLHGSIRYCDNGIEWVGDYPDWVRSQGTEDESGSNSLLSP